NYTTSASTGRSLLTSVQVYGKDATVDASANVTSGTTLPAITATYPQPAVGATDLASGTAGASVGTGQPTYGVGDFNGDGKKDYAFRAANTNSWYVLISNGTTFTSQFWGNQATSAGTGVPDEGFGDFNGDGKTDFFYRGSDSSNFHVMLSTGSSFT